MVLAAADHSPWAPGWGGGLGVGGAWRGSRGEPDACEWRGHRGPPRKRQGEVMKYMCSVAQSCPTLCNLTDGSLPGSSVHGILPARTLESGLPFPPPGGLLDAGMEPKSDSPVLAGRFFTTGPPGNP